jgi:glycosyltransferase involved in cell wall biosynthesis
MKISIVTINFNNEIGLTKTIESVVEQTYQDFEYIVIDGGSKDRSKEIIQRHSDRLAYWVSESDKGIYNAINKGISKASGDYLLILNSGDCLYNPDTLMQIAPYLDNKNDIIYGKTLLVNGPDGDQIKDAPQTLSFEYISRHSLVHQSMFVRKDLHNQVGLYNEQLSIVADWAFTLDALAFFKARAVYAPLVISKYDMTGISNRHKEKRLKEKKDYLEAKYQFFISAPPQTLMNSTKRLLKKILPQKVINLLRRN